MGNKNIKLTRFEEAFTSENWIVRIYRRKDRPNRLFCNILVGMEFHSVLKILLDIILI